jgi:hypothetical protein
LTNVGCSFCAGLTSVTAMTMRYIILFENSFRSRDWHRFGCDVFAAKGFQVIAVQTTDAPPEDFSETVYRCCDRAALDQCVGAVQAEDVVLNLVVLSPRSVWIYDWLRERRVRYMIMSRGGLPLSFVGFRSALGPSDWLHLRAGGLRQWVGTKCRWLARRREVMRAPPPRWWLRAGRRPDRMANLLYPRVGRAEILPMLHFDVEAAQSAPEYRAAWRPYAVFLDQMMLDHPELKLELMKMSSEVDPERYHPALERCFRIVEDQTGFDVIVAPHPKATPQSNARFGRRVVDMPTASLVRGSSLVLCHYTTAVSFPVIFHKPVMFLTTDKMETNASGVMVARLSSWLGERRINIDHLPYTLPIPVVAETNYRKYQQVFLYSEAPLDWNGVLARVVAEAAWSTSQMSVASSVTAVSRIRPDPLFPAV